MARLLLDESEPMSIDEFICSIYYHEGIWELFRGELVGMSPAVSWHDFTVNRISYLFQSVIEARGGRCRVGGSNTAVLHHDDSFVMPDVFVSCDETRMNEKGRYAAAPELIVEVLSPATRAYCLGEKKDLYREAGAEEYWAVDTDARYILVENFRTGFKKQFSMGDSIQSDFDSGFNLDVADVFKPIMD
ncbi:MAG: Uma2 family endonuclease [Peptococcaceae bacterium]|nr:Uma2 family endonuclease [Peptococcaceae bacterium]